MRDRLLGERIECRDCLVGLPVTPSTQDARNEKSEIIALWLRYSLVTKELNEKGQCKGRGLVDSALVPDVRKQFLNRPFSLRRSARVQAPNLPGHIGCHAVGMT